MEEETIIDIDADRFFDLLSKVKKVVEKVEKDLEHFDNEEPVTVIREYYEEFQFYFILDYCTFGLLEKAVNTKSIADESLLKTYTNIYNKFQELKENNKDKLDEMTLEQLAIISFNQLNYLQQLLSELEESD